MAAALFPSRVQGRARLPSANYLVPGSPATGQTAHLVEAVADDRRTRGWALARPLANRPPQGQAGPHRFRRDTTLRSIAPSRSLRQARRAVVPGGSALRLAVAILQPLERHRCRVLGTWTNPARAQRATRPCHAGNPDLGRVPQLGARRAPPLGGLPSVGHPTVDPASTSVKVRDHDLHSLPPLHL